MAFLETLLLVVLLAIVIVLACLAYGAKEATDDAIRSFFGSFKR